MLRAYEAILEADVDKVNGEIFNAGWENKSVKDIALTVKNILGEDIKLIVTPTNDNRSYHISSEKIKKVLNFSTKFTIEDAVKDMKNAFKKRRDLIIELLNDIPDVFCATPGGAFYAFPNVIGTGMNGEEFAKKCLHKAGVAIIPGTSFGKKAVNHVRFSFAATQDSISQALENIKKMLS